MPLTVLSHQAAVLPLKLWRPAWFSGTGLVIGSMAPDLEYFWWGTTSRALGGHTWAGQLTFCLPLGLVLTALSHRLAPVVAPHLPDAGPLRLHDFALAGSRPEPFGLRWAKVALSILIGSCSHVVWDGFTHVRGWVPALDATAFVAGGTTWRWCNLLQQASTITGALVTLALLVVIGRRRRLREWTAREPDPRRATLASHAALWLPVGLGALIGSVASLAASPDGPLRARLIDAWLRGTSLAFVGQLLGAALASGLLASRHEALGGGQSGRDNRL